MEGIKVVSSDKQSRMDARGKTTDVYVVWVETDRGSTGQIEVPISKWNKDDLEIILAEERDRLDLAFTL